MLDLLEKISAIFGGIVVLAVGVLYLVFGVPPAGPREFVESVSITDAPPAASSPASKGPAAPEVSPSEPEPNASQSEAAILSKLQKGQGLQPAGGLQRKTAKIPAATFGYIKPEASWMPELKLVQKRILSGPGGDTRLKLERVAENSLLKRFGIDEGDVIELIDGEILEFNDESVTRYRQLFKEKLETLENGGAVSVTLTRRGQPVHIMFSLK
jgi:hypothetical protein